MSGAVLDLGKHRRIREDIYDRLLVESRRKEPRKSLERVRERLAGRSLKSRAKAYG
jgi:hypothetical protein